MPLQRATLFELTSVLIFLPSGAFIMIFSISFAPERYMRFRFQVLYFLPFFIFFYAALAHLATNRGLESIPVSYCSPLYFFVPWLE